jgi:hypothetical protein
MGGEFELAGIVAYSWHGNASTLYRVAQAVRTSPIDGLIALSDNLPTASAQGRGRELTDAVVFLLR